VGGARFEVEVAAAAEHGVSTAAAQCYRVGVS
jgi:hypothetical protein